jgi:hypothetical protein
VIVTGDWGRFFSCWISPIKRSTIFGTLCCCKNFHCPLSSGALVGSYLEDKYQCMSVGGVLSELIAVTRGVVHGFVLGSLLFSKFINDIIAQIDFCRFHMYTDDVQLYLSDDPCSLDECIHRMNADLN